MYVGLSCFQRQGFQAAAVEDRWLYTAALEERLPWCASFEYQPAELSIASTRARAWNLLLPSGLVHVLGGQKVSGVSTPEQNGLEHRRNPNAWSEYLLD